MNSQYKKASWSCACCPMLKNRDRYGYEISEYLAAQIDIADGTVYRFCAS